ncbi:hypothetical protein ACQ3G6_10560 [Allorhizobium undicola]|uniref:hypothetical protein n=1 Tax=Allorhizobium undicola TaxID=78527 RepID=UPI003D352F09
MRIFKLFGLGLAAFTVMTGTPYSADSHRFVFVNDTKAALIRLTFRSIDGTGGKTEVLNKHGLGIGKSRVISVPNDGTCKYGVLGEFEQDGGYYDLMDKVDLCGVGRYTLRDR